MSTNPKYDIIIAGAGLAGLSLAYKIKSNQNIAQQSILLIDPTEKNKNDRTWCFWSKEKDLFDSILYKKWGRIHFGSDQIEKQFDIKPYTYKMIRGIDFYNHVLSFLKAQPGVEFVKAKIDDISKGDKIVNVRAGGNHYSSQWLFKSYYDNIDFSKSHFVWQHFKGWIIETDHDCFDPELAGFMDFRLPQDDETRFCYVLPFDKRNALVELAIFSENIPESSFYDNYLENYINDILKIKHYKINDIELGAIPMTTFKFSNNQDNRIINIGTNGGSVKASSGYAFNRIQKETDRIVDHIINDNLLRYRHNTSRFQFYDRILLNAILSNKTTGKEVFESLFLKLDPQTIFKFLDEEGSFFNDLKVFTAPPTLPFFKAFLEEIVHS